MKVAAMALYILNTPMVFSLMYLWWKHREELPVLRPIGIIYLVGVAVFTVGTVAGYL